MMQFQGLGIVNERRELFLRLRYTSHSSTCVATLVIPLKLRILNLIPFHASDAESLSGNYPCIQDRLTRRQLLFLRNPTPLRSSKFPFEYLLLPPRSALEAAPLLLTQRSLAATSTPAYSLKHRYSPQRLGMSITLECHPFSRPIHSAGELLHTLKRVPTSMATSLLSK